MEYRTEDQRHAGVIDSRQTLFIDAAPSLGTLIDRVHREFSGDRNSSALHETYHAWRGTDDPLRNPHSEFVNTQTSSGCRKSASPDDGSARMAYVLTPGRSPSGAGREAEDEGEPFGEKMTRLSKRVERASSPSQPPVYDNREQT